MLSKTITDALNQQIEKEGYASFLYLSMATWCDSNGLQGCTRFFRRQSEEEHVHMTKIIDYILEMDGRAIIPQIKQPPTEYKGVSEVFESTYEHEKKVTSAINSLVDLALEENDHSTHNFLQWYVEEQREEENLIRSILDKIKLIGQGEQALYYIDKEVEEINLAIKKSGA
ncbi:MAG: ferritin [Saprospiraceae bacterium]|nr:ferritin [Saprospiraceae bacterium]